jgi:aminoglycoside phosphotransferase family enzyme
MLDARIARGAVTRADVRGLVATLARFYARAERCPMDGRAYRNAIAADVDAKHASLRQPRYGLDPAEVRAAADGLGQWLERHGESLEERAPRVVDAHGDLRPEHVCFEAEPVVIDCLEFSRSLRLLDPASELSFLALECRRLGAAWMGDELLAAYGASTGDVVPGSVIAFYEGYHALVRATIAVWHLDDAALDHSTAWVRKGSGYLRMAAEGLGAPTAR